MAPLPAIGAPATAALESVGITTLELVAGRPARRLLSLHGVGPRAIRILQEALAAAGLDPLT